MEKRTIFFDMDGTIADLYGVDNWLEYLINSNTYPYANAKPMLHFATFARMLNTLQREGYRIGIISWLSKGGTEEYNERVKKVKLAWLAKHLPSVQFDEINIVPYGTMKRLFAKNYEDILFDDEYKNRAEWQCNAYGVDNIIESLKVIKEDNKN